MPVIADGDNLNKRAVGGARDIFLIDRRLQKTAAETRGPFKPAVDDPRRQRVDQLAAIVFDRVVFLKPRAQHRHADQHWQAGFDEHARTRRIGVGLAEISDRGGTGRCFPVAEILADQRLEHLGVIIARNHDDCLVGPIPAIAECTQRRGSGGVERVRRANGRPGAERLPGKKSLTRRIADLLLRAQPFAQFGQHGAAFGIDRRGVQKRARHHPRQDLDRLIKARRGRARQIQLVDRLCWRRCGIGVRPEGRAQALPDAFCLFVRNETRPAKAQMLVEMGKALFAWALHQRTRVDGNAYRHLVRRHAIATHGIAQPVGQLAEHPFGIGRNVAATVKPRPGWLDRSLCRNGMHLALRNRRNGQRKGEEERG